MKFFNPILSSSPTACALYIPHHPSNPSPFASSVHHRYCHQGNKVRVCHSSHTHAQPQSWLGDVYNSTKTSLASLWNERIWTNVKNQAVHMYAATSEFGLRNLHAAREIGVRTASTIADFLKELCLFIAGKFVNTSSILKIFIDNYTHKIIDYIGDMINKVKDYAINNTYGFVLTAFSVCFSIFMAIHRERLGNTEGMLYLIFTGIGLYLNRPGCVISCAPNAIRFILSMFTGRQYQGPREDFKKVLISAFTCAAILKCETAGLTLSDWSPKNLEEMMKRTVLVGRTLQTWNVVADKFAEFFDDLVGIVTKYLYKTEYYSTRRIAELEAWVTKVLQYISLGNQMNVGRSKDTAIEIEALYTQYLIFRTRYAGNRKAIELLNSYGHVITELYNKVCNKNPNAHKMRQEPVCVVVRGGAGIGKSYLMDSLKEDLLKICGRYNGTVDPDASIYSRCHEQEFWDGYAGQPIVIFDDGFQQVDSVANPNPEFFEIIRSVNIFPYNLHSANLHEKANNPFNSEFVVVTTNLTNFKPASIHSEDALIRRLHIVVDLELIPEVKNSRGGVDGVKLRRYRERNNLPPSDMSHLIFHIQKLDGTKVNGDYDEFVVSISKQYEAHEISFNQRQNNSDIRKHEKLPPGCYTKDTRWQATNEEQEESEGRSNASTRHGSMTSEEQRQREAHQKYLDEQKQRLEEKEPTFTSIAEPVQKNGEWYLQGHIFVPYAEDNVEEDEEGDKFSDAGDIHFDVLGNWHPIRLPVAYNLAGFEWEFSLLEGVKAAVCLEKKWFVCEPSKVADLQFLAESLGYTFPPDEIDYQGHENVHKGRYIKVNQFACLSKEQQMMIMQMRWLVWYNRVYEDPDECYKQCETQEQFEETYEKLKPVINKKNGYYEVPAIVLAKAVKSEEFEEGIPSEAFVMRLKKYYEEHGAPVDEEESWTYYSVRWLLMAFYRWQNWLRSSRMGLLATMAIGIAVCAALTCSIKAKFANSTSTCYDSIVTATFWGLVHRETWICALGNVALGTTAFNTLSKPLALLEPCLYVLRHTRFHRHYGIEECRRCFSAEAQSQRIVETLKHHQIDFDSMPSKPNFDAYNDPQKRTPEEDIKYYMGQEVNVEDVKQLAKVDLESSTHYTEVRKIRPKLESNTHYSEARKVRPKLENNTPFHMTLTKALEESGRACDPNWRKKQQYEAPYSSQSHDMMTKCLKNHMLLFIRAAGETVDREMYVGQIFVVSGRVALINHHFISTMGKMLQDLASTLPKNDNPIISIFVRAPQLPARHLLEYGELLNAPIVKRGEVDTEFRVIRLPLSMPARANLVPQFIQKKELGKVSAGHRVLCGVHAPSGGKFDRVYRSGEYLRSEDIEMSDPNDDLKSIIYRESGTVRVDTVKGDCGGVYVINSDAFEHKILGLHYGGTPGQGHFSFLTQEDLLPLIADDYHAADVELVLEEEKVPENFPLEGKFEYVGTLDKAVVQPLKTSKVPSVIFEKVIPTSVAPSYIRPPLTPDGPMLKGIEKYAGEHIPMERKHLVSARFSYQSKVAQVPILPRDTKIMSFEEGCMGIAGDEAYPPIKRTKSAGWPYSREATKGKQKWLGSEEWDLTTPDALKIRRDVEKLIERCNEREIPEAYFVDTLKDETRPIEKVLAKKTRVFSAAPMHLTIAIRMYYGGWMAHMYRNRIQTECCCGINSKDTFDQREWTTIAKKMRRFGPKTLIAGDFSNFDGSMQLDLQMEVLKVIQAYYSDGAREQRIRKALWFAMCQSMHILGPFAYRHSHGQPSGNPTTVYTNSVYNSLAIRYCWSKYFGDCTDFNTNAEVVVYGDDNIISIHPTCKEFDAVELAKQFNSFGMTYTSESKGEQSAEFRSIDEVTFLKREFKWSKEHRMFFAPLALSSILEMTNWVNKELNEVEAVTDNCIYALLELYHHEKDVCELWQPKIVAALREATGYTLPLLSWEEARMSIVAGDLDKVYQRQVVRV